MIIRRTSISAEESWRGEKESVLSWLQQDLLSNETKEYAAAVIKWLDFAVTWDTYFTTPVYSFPILNGDVLEKWTAEF